MKGPAGQWYRGVARHFEGFLQRSGATREVAFTLDHTRDDAIDAAYFAKYGNGSPSRAITGSLAKQTTMRIDPR